MTAGDDEQETRDASTIARLLRERDQLFSLHEALADVERARTVEERLRILVQAIQRLGYAQVETIDGYRIPAHANVVSLISNSAYLDTRELVVPLRAVGGATVATLVLRGSAEPGPPSLAHVRTVELFAQQVASIIENARLYEESQLERGRGEAISDIARAIGSSLRLTDVMRLSLRHASALLRSQGATVSLMRDEHLIIVAAHGVGELLLGAPLPIDGSLTGKAVRESRTIICNDTSDPDMYSPSRIAANIERTLIAPLISSTGELGALSVVNREAPFTDDDATVLQCLADQVAVAISNARLYEEARDAAERYRKAIEDERRARDAVAASEGRYRNLFESASDAIYTLDAQGGFTSVNEATTEIAGRPREELLGRSALIMVSPSDVPTVKEHFKAALAGFARRYECHFVRPDGSKRLASVTNTPIRHASQVIGILGVARDVTVDRERAVALERSESRYTRLVEAASDAIFTVGSDALLTAVNRSLERASGKCRAELLGTPFWLLLDARDREAAAIATAEALAGSRRRADLRYPGLDGEVRFCSLTLTPLMEGDTVSGALGIVRDVTDEKRMTEQLVQQEKLAAVGQLVSGVAHELNNPLASVMAFAQLLLVAPPGGGHDTRAIEAINQEAKRAAKIVSNLLTFARQHQPERTVADLNRVVEDTLELRRYALRIAQVEVETRLAADLPITWADPFQLQQVVLNLVTNAEHALTSWEGQRRIVVSTSARDGQLIVCVSDTGPGIASEVQSRIFNPFYTTKPVGEGTGLGLSISDGIVREHGGRIRVESVLDQGASFFVEIPYVTPPAAVEMPSGAGLTQITVARRILVIDDEPAIRSAVATFFRSLGHTVDLAGTGHEGITRATTGTYDALLLDLRLPDLSGDEVLRRLELGGITPRRVVFITGDTTSDDARAALDATGRPVVSKPFLLDALAAVVLAEAEA